MIDESNIVNYSGWFVISEGHEASASFHGNMGLWEFHVTNYAIELDNTFINGKSG